MRLQAEIIVRRAPDDVAAFLGDVRNIPSWDRGVAAIRTAPDAKPGVGFAFETKYLQIAIRRGDLLMITTLPTGTM
jgi:hypothetical protein